MRFYLGLFFLSLFIAACSEQKTEQEDMLTTREITYSTDTTEMQGYLAYDSSIEGRRPGIVVVHEWWGHNEYARKRARMLAELGYVALAVDMYGEGKTADHPSEAGKFAGAVMQNLDAAKARFLAALNVLKEQDVTDSTQLGAIGYCFGGGVVLHMARMGIDLEGVVSFHGSLGTETPADSGDIKAGILVCHGAEDPFVKPETIEAFKNEMDSAGADYKFISYPGAVHSFTNPAADSVGKAHDLPLAYNESADRKSWEDMKQFFDRIFE